MDDKEYLEPTPEYTKSFNDGYLLAKNVPELSETLAKAVGSSERDLGFKAGREQYLNEQKENKYPDWLKNKRTPDKNDLSKEKDKDDIDRE